MSNLKILNKEQEKEKNIAWKNNLMQPRIH